MTTYDDVIKHTMIVEDERSEDKDEDFLYEGVNQLVRHTPRIVCNHTQDFHEFNLSQYHN